MRHPIRYLAPFVCLLAFAFPAQGQFTAGVASPFRQPLSLAQLPGGHVVANITLTIGATCLPTITTSLASFGPPNYFEIFTDIGSCPGSATTAVPYAPTVDLGLIPDGDYKVVFSFIAGGYGTVGNAFIQSFSIRSGVLQYTVARGVTGLWWNPSESGWGLFLSQRQNMVFAAWYTYDELGKPTWYVAPNCELKTDGTNGDCYSYFYEVKGPKFFGQTFDSAAANVVNLGSVHLTFTDVDHASFTYTFVSTTGVGASRTIPVIRQIFDVQQGAAPPVDYTDLWWNPSESGWGLTIAHQFDTIFLAWYVYDAAGNPTWFVVPNCVVTQSTCSGVVYSTTGPALGPTFDSSQVRVATVGSANVVFTDANNAVLSYTVNGIPGTKSITRQLF